MCCSTFCHRERAGSPHVPVTLDMVQIHMHMHRLLGSALFAAPCWRMSGVADKPQTFVRHHGWGRRTRDAAAYNISPRGPPSRHPRDLLVQSISRRRKGRNNPKTASHNRYSACPGCAPIMTRLSNHASRGLPTGRHHAPSLPGSPDLQYTLARTRHIIALWTRRQQPSTLLLPALGCGQAH